MRRYDRKKVSGSWFKHFLRLHFFFFVNPISVDKRLGYRPRILLKYVQLHVCVALSSVFIYEITLETFYGVFFRFALNFFGSNSFCFCLQVQEREQEPRSHQGQQR